MKYTLILILSIATLFLFPATHSLSQAHEGVSPEEAIQPLPSGILEKDVTQSDLVVSISLNEPKFLSGNRQADFLNFSISEAAYVYLFQINPEGKVRLLFPNEFRPNNQLAFGEHIFPGNLAPSFETGPIGDYTLQIIASQRPLLLGPDISGVELGANPEYVRRAIEILIDQADLTLDQWTLDWEQYEVVDSLATSAPPSKYYFSAVDPLEDHILGAELVLDSFTEGVLRPEVLKRVIRDRPQLAFLDDQVDYRIRVSANGFESPNNCQLTNRLTGSKETNDLCIIKSIGGSEFNVSFVLRPVRNANFTFTATPCTYKEITFNAASSEQFQDIIEYEWDFGNDTSLRKGSVSETHTYLEPGLYEVELQVKYSDGFIDTAKKTVKVAPDGTKSSCPPDLFQPSASHPSTFISIDPSFQVEITEGKATIPVYRSSAASLLPDSEQIELRFSYLVEGYPSRIFSDIDPTVVFSYLNLIFLDFNGDRIRSERIQILNNDNFAQIAEGMLQEKVVTQQVPRGAVFMHPVLFAAVIPSSNNTPEPLVISYEKFHQNEVTASKSCASLQVDSFINLLGEPIEFEFNNSCNLPITLSERWWRVRSVETGDIMFHFDQSRKILSSGQTEKSTWLQNTNEGKVLVSGKPYSLEVLTEDGAVYSKHFTIL